MALYQKAVLERYIKALDKKLIQEKYQAFKAHFHNPTIQENIKKSKEEQYQEGFLTDLFVNIFGYTKNPNEGYNLTTELKNVKDAKKADGAILINDKVIAIVELKGMSTTNLDSIENQAFNYKNNQVGCTYVITSNFQKIRLYIDNAVTHQEWDLFTITKEDFQELYLSLAYENIKCDLPKTIKDKSLSEQDTITKKLYKDYSNFKKELYQDLVKNNPDIDQLTLFKKAQKLLDRFLFLFFAEDRGLLQPQSVRTIVKRWNQAKDLDLYHPLMDSYRKYFGYLNDGYQSKDLVVYAYNGGLFAPDEILDKVIVSDKVLEINTLKISDYDFESEVDVNILGHIFENSLNELEEVEAEIRGEAVEKTKTKRKKDGVFYTPKYITKYIVDNTVGKLCQEKKEELEIKEEEYTHDASVKLTKSEKEKEKLKKKQALDKLEAYRTWLLQITICDPACGSGAFLNQALEFLIEEHAYIDELQAKLFGDALVLTDIEGSILENNLYGVDINDESIEIAKLSLWLRTAEPNRKLTSLSNNLKSGNSLIDDPAIAGDKAFNWEQEFPHVFAKGGFDVIIGNPPYVKEANNKSAFNGLHNHPCYQGKMDLWYFFGDLALEIIKNEKGYICYIAPNNWITNDGAEKFRNRITKDSQLINYIDFGDFKIFEDAGIQTMIYVMKKDKSKNEYQFDYSKITDSKITINQVVDFLNTDEVIEFSTSFSVKFHREKFINNTFSFTNVIENNILEKMMSKSNFNLDKSEIFSGIDIGQDFINQKSKDILGNEFSVGEGVFNLSNNELERLNLTDNEKSIIKPFYTTKEINRYYYNTNNQYWVIYTDSKFKNPNEINDFPNIKVHLDKFSKIITSDNKPYGLHRSRNENIFKGKKILSIRKCTSPSFTFVEFDSYVNRTFNIIKTERISLSYLTVLLNSNIIKFWFLRRGKLQGDLFQIDMNPIISVPIKNISLEAQQPFIEMAEKMLALNKDLQNTSHKFSKLLASELGLIEPSKKLQEWYNLEFTDFAKELKKKKIDLSLAQKAEWMDFFETEKQKVNQIQAEIQATDKQIDQMVYDLYELTPEEIQIVENS